jgi:hypothetical protein
MRRNGFASLTFASCVGAAIALTTGSARAQAVSRPTQSTPAVPPYHFVQPQRYVPGNPYRGTVAGPSYVGPWYTYAARPFRPRPLVRRGDPTQEFWWPTGRGVPLAKPWLGR